MQLHRLRDECEAFTEPLNNFSRIPGFADQLCDRKAVELMLKTVINNLTTFRLGYALTQNKSHFPTDLYLDLFSSRL